ncbi:hypothetical protein EDC04DRAFT_2604967 [Pisolithus marmoratus]|nr:hypothetical protein EDC04DRAFT_2604967 [Pisolithus marmoratus]
MPLDNVRLYLDTVDRHLAAIIPSVIMQSWVHILEFKTCPPKQDNLFDHGVSDIVSIRTNDIYRMPNNRTRYEAGCIESCFHFFLHVWAVRWFIPEEGSLGKLLPEIGVSFCAVQPKHSEDAGISRSYVDTVTQSSPPSTISAAQRYCQDHPGNLAAPCDRVRVAVAGVSFRDGPPSHAMEASSPEYPSDNDCAIDVVEGGADYVTLPIYGKCVTVLWLTNIVPSFRNTYPSIEVHVTELVGWKIRMVTASKWVSVLEFGSIQWLAQVVKAVSGPVTDGHGARRQTYGQIEYLALGENGMDLNSRFKGVKGYVWPHSHSP